MTNLIPFDRIQFFSILFSMLIFFFIFSLVKNRRVKEEYSILWFAMSFFLLYLSLDRYAIDRLGTLFGIAYPPSVLTLMTTGFTFLLLIHMTVVITRLSDQNKELIQEMGLGHLRLPTPRHDFLIIVPAYNEAASIGQVIEELQSSKVGLDVLVVNDGSLDTTSQTARRFDAVIVIDLPKNLGIGGAVQTGFKYAARQGYRRAMQFDGDGQHLAAEIPKMVTALEQSQSDMVIGSRFLGVNAGFRSTFARRLGIRIFDTLNSLLIRQRVTDNTSGFRLYGRRAIEFLAVHYPVDYPEPEAVILLGKNGFQISEVAVEMRPRQKGDSSISGIQAVYYMIKVILAILMTALRRPLVQRS